MACGKEQNDASDFQNQHAYTWEKIGRWMLGNGIDVDTTNRISKINVRAATLLLSVPLPPYLPTPAGDKLDQANMDHGSTWNHTKPFLRVLPRHEELPRLVSDTVYLPAMR